jgi:hypothetical protein
VTVRYLQHDLVLPTTTITKQAGPPHSRRQSYTRSNKLNTTQLQEEKSTQPFQGVRLRRVGEIVGEQRDDR